MHSFSFLLHVKNKPVVSVGQCGNQVRQFCFIANCALNELKLTVIK